MGATYWTSSWQIWLSDRNVWVNCAIVAHGLVDHLNRTRACRTGIMYGRVGQPRHNSWTARTGFRYGMLGHPKRIHGRVILELCMACLTVCPECMDDLYGMSVWPCWPSEPKAGELYWRYVCPVRASVPTCMEESYCMSVWHAWASEQQSWTSRIGCMHGMCGRLSGMHGRVVLDVCMPLWAVRTEVRRVVRYYCMALLLGRHTNDHGRCVLDVCMVLLAITIITIRNLIVIVIIIMPSPCASACPQPCSTTTTTTTY